MANPNPNTSGLTSRQKGDPGLPGAGRKKSKYKQFLEEMGIDRTDLSKEDFGKMQLALLDMTEAELVAVETDPERPMSIRKTAKEILGERGYYAVNDIADRQHGKATNSTTVSGPDGGPAVFHVVDARPNVDILTDAQ